jgi:hypothetical protein
MTKMHVVVDMDINGFLRAFETREEAVAYVGRLLRTNGDDYVRDLAVARQTEDDRLVEIVSGDELLALVRNDGKAELVGSGGGDRRGTGTKVNT